jgi:uncharacterized protein involved in exopolysaccharide biosynthesis
LSQQNLDMRGSMQTARRHKGLIVVFAVLGLLLAAGYAYLNPLLQSSTALVVFSDNYATSSQAQVSAVDPGLATQVVIAGSAPVLAEALPHISPAVSLRRCRAESPSRA